MSKKAVIVAHLAFWFLSVTMDLLPLTTVNDIVKIQQYLSTTLIDTFFCIVTFYIFYILLAPLLLKRRMFPFILLFVIFIIGFTYLLAVISPFLYNIFLVKPVKAPAFSRIFTVFVSIHVFYSLSGTMARLALDWFVSKQKQKELEKQNIAGELALLRSQINPHFLFNTLNNLNSFVHRDPETAYFGITKLSEIMRYMIYDTSIDKVFLENEINYINNYIALQKLRIKDPDFIKFQIAGKTNDVQISPLLLIPFVENAFKHGRKNVEGTGINIELNISDDILSFHVGNYILNAEKISNEVRSGGFGLKNIRRRLDLLYHDKYSLEIKNDGDNFSVRLVLKL